MPRYKVFESLSAGDQMRCKEVKRCKTIGEAFRIFEDMKIEPLPGICQSISVWSCRDKEIVARKTG